MKRIILILILSISYFPAFTQNEEQTVTLDEVIVKGAKVVSKVDGQIIYPTDAQKSASNNGYSLLQKLSLPNLRIDNVTHSISVIDNRGGVQVRINGINVGKEEMLALDPKLIGKVDFIDNPGVRYGEDIAYVINIITKRNDTGYTLGTDVTSLLTSWRGNGMVYGKWNSGKSEFSASYDLSGNKTKELEVKETTDYTLNDGSIQTIGRNDVETLRKRLAHDVKLTYNYADSTAYVIQVSLSDNIGNEPGNYSVKDVVDGDVHQTATYRNSHRSNSPVLNLYLFRQLKPRQSITANVVGTYINTNTNNYFDEGAPYQYDVKGRTASALTEVIYENRLKPFILSAGLNHRYKYTKNDYIGDASALTEMNLHNLYAFSEIKGTLKYFRYVLGLGASYIHYSQNKHNYNLWTFRPIAMLSYSFLRGMNLRYSFELKDRASRIAMINDATIKTNSMEMTKGNPNLKPTRDIDQSLRLSYNNQRWSTYIEGFYRYCNKPNMAYYVRTSDDKFIYTQINQKEIDLLRFSVYVSCWILPEKLQASAYGGMQRCFNYGNDYSHFHTSWFYVGSVTAYLGNFILQGYIDNGHRFLEGEKKGYNGAYSTIQASYQHKDWQISLSWSNPFVNKYKSSEAEILNSNLHKLTTVYDRASGNQVSIGVSWRMSRGKKYQSADRKISLKDTDDGIMK